MDSFQEAIDLLNGLDVDKMLSKIMDGLSESIIKINQDDQLDFGIDAKGRIIKTDSAIGGNVYAFATIKKRGERGKQTDNVDLNFTGKFWKTFKVKKVSEGWDVQADFDIHGDSIWENFSEGKFDFLGLTDENLKDFVLKEVLPKLEIEIKRFLKI